jgi:transposase
VLSWGEQDTFVIMRRTRYICYHGENKIHLLSWGEQDTFVIIGKTRYICYHGESKIHFSLIPVQFSHFPTRVRTNR